MDKIGVFICKSCDIGERLNVEDLIAVAQEQGVNCVHSLDFLCSKEGKSFIDEKIKEEGLEGVSICACSFRVNYDVFNFGKVAVDRVSLRESVVWSRFPLGENGEVLEDTVEVASGVSFKDELMALAKDYI
ncbi:MAG: heterodisulfide reductase subunit A, partial [Caldimicrobium sp.]